METRESEIRDEAYHIYTNSCGSVPSTGAAFDAGYEAKEREIRMHLTQAIELRDECDTETKRFVLRPLIMTLETMLNG